MNKYILSHTHEYGVTVHAFECVNDLTWCCGTYTGDDIDNALAAEFDRIAKALGTSIELDRVEEVITLEPVINFTTITL